MGGRFDTLGGQARNRIGQLYTAGSLLSAFDLDVVSSLGSRNLNCGLLQEDGELVLGGRFTSLAGETHIRLVRLNSDGAVGSAFTPSFNGGVICLVQQADGRLLVGGAFANASGQARGQTTAERIQVGRGPSACASAGDPSVGETLAR